MICIYTPSRRLLYSLPDPAPEPTAQPELAATTASASLEPRLNFHPTPTAKQFNMHALSSSVLAGGIVSRQAAAGKARSGSCRAPARRAVVVRAEETVEEAARGADESIGMGGACPAPGAGRGRDAVGRVVGGSAPVPHTAVVVPNPARLHTPRLFSQAPAGTGLVSRAPAAAA